MEIWCEISAGREFFAQSIPFDNLCKQLHKFFSEKGGEEQILCMQKHGKIVLTAWQNYLLTFAFNVNNNRQQRQIVR